MTTLPPRPCCSAREVCYVTMIHLELKIEANLSVMSTQTVCVWSHAKKSVAPESWSGKRGSNSRPQPWQGCALPLSYSRIFMQQHSTENPTPVNTYSELFFISSGHAIIKYTTMDHIVIIAAKYNKTNPTTPQVETSG